MPLPDFNEHGDLPVGVHRVSLEEAVERFGTGSLQRQLVTKRLLRIYQLAFDTGKLDRFIIFGSYVTDKPQPKDVDIILLMKDDFEVVDYDETTQLLFNHAQAQEVFGASVFSLRTVTILLETPDAFVAHWQVKRDHTRRGIIELLITESKELS